MKKIACAVAALVPTAALVLSMPHVSAAPLPEIGVVRDGVHDVVGFDVRMNSIDLTKVVGWRRGGFLYGRIHTGNVLPGEHTGQQFVLWVKAPSGTLYLSTARNGILQEPPVRQGHNTLCASPTKVFWDSTNETVTWRMPMSCFVERPRGWRVGGVGSIGHAWDQTGTRDLAKFSPLFANTP
jgi:hypothetical protein